MKMHEAEAEAEKRDSRKIWFSGADSDGNFGDSDNLDGRERAM